MKNIAIVTGASSGIGEAFVREILSDSSYQEIWVIARRIQKLETLKNETNGNKIVPISADLTSRDDISMIEEKISQEKPQIKLLVNCAGMGKRGNVEEHNEKAITDTIDLNCTALSLLSKICLPFMKDIGGARIINVASTAAFLPQPGFATYSASKAYVVSLSRALDYEFKKYGIRVTTVCPGPVRTEFQSRATDGQSGDFTGFRKLVVADPVKLAKGSIKASKRGRKMYVYGLSQKLLHVAAKIIPADLILAIETAGK